MSKHDSPGCVEPESLAAFVDHGLSLTERARVETHLASCPRCTALLAEVVRTVADMPAFSAMDGRGVAEPAPRHLRRAVLGALATAAAVFAVVAAPPLAVRWIDRDAGLVDLAGGLGEQRTVLGRLTGGLPHAPLRTPSAGGQDGLAGRNDRVELTASRIRESFGDLPTPSELHAAGVADLLNGRLDSAAYALAAASREQPANARYLNDVATVYLERARRGLRPDDLPRAFAAAEGARRLDPSLQEAWFNRALALQALSLTDHARAAWTEYLARDSASPWAAEARTRLDEVTRPTAAAAWSAIEARLQQRIDPDVADEAVRANTTEARNLIENQLLVAWADAVLAGGNGAAELDRARVMAESMLRVAGDALYRDAIAVIDRSAGPAATALATGHLAYTESAALFVADRIADATPKLQSAHALLVRAGSPFAARAAIDLAAARYVMANYNAALSTLRDTAAAAESNNYVYVGGRAAWIEGMVAFAQGRIGDARACYDLALSRFELMGDVEQAVAAHTLLTALHFYLGDPVNEWRHRQQALDGLTRVRSERLRYQVMAATAASVRHNNPETALAIQDVVLESALQSGRHSAIVEAYAQRAGTLIALGRHGEAEASLAAAVQALHAIEDPTLKQLFELLVLGPKGDLERIQNPAAALATAQRAVEIITARNARADRSRLPQFQLQLARAYLALGRLALAETALNSGIQALDEERALLADEGRLSSSSESWQLFDTAVELAVRKGDIAKGFELAERGHMRTLAERQPAADVPSLDTVRARLRSNEAVIALNQFEGGLAVWVIRHDQVTVKVRPLKRTDAVRLVRRQQAEIKNQSPSTQAGRDLFNEIVRPISTRLQGVSHLIFVPDGPFTDASFAALWDTSRQRYLIEHFATSAATSVTAYLQSKRPPSRFSNAFVALAAASAPERAGAIARLYTASETASGQNATRSAVLAKASANSIVHIAAPIQANSSYPMLARVLLADEPGRRYSGALFGHDIASAPLTQTDVVVIEPIATDQNRGEGTIDIARAFRAAGVPAVLATLPGADESATRDLMVGFHQRLASSVPPVEALTDLQRKAIRQNGGRLGAWAALVLYGSDR